MFQREPTRVIGYLLTAAVLVYSKIRGLEYEDVLAQGAAFVVAIEAIRAKVTPYIERAKSLRDGLHGDDLK